MEYGINIDFFEPLIGLEKAASLIAKAGFTKLDYTPRPLDENWRDRAKEALRIFSAYGLSVHQTHAPFNRYGKYGDMHAICLDRCAEATELLGASFMVAHGDEFDFEHLTFSSEAALEYNHDLFLPYVERARKSGYQLAFETVFEDWDRRRFSARIEELRALITSFGEGAACCCWDFGHANVAFKKQAVEHIEAMGSLIRCTHLHDNTGRDSHQLPFTGTIDWKATMAAFKRIGYDGVLSVEYSHGSMPEALMEDFIKLTFETTRYAYEQ